MLAIMIIHLLAEQNARAIRKRHPTLKDGKQRMRLRSIGTLGEQIPEQRSSQTDQVKGRIGLDLRILRVVKGFRILLTSGLLFLLELITHEESRFTHRRQTDTECRTLKINDLDQASLGRHTLQCAIHVVLHELS